MKKLSPVVILALSYYYSLAPAMLAQNPQPSPERGRPVIVKVAPSYPEAARRIHLGGTVKAIALVGFDGKVKKVDAVGGSPLLMQAAQDAISHWKFAPGQETQETVELHFTP
jgi:outer membrane biosynthesis protein TonB